MTRAALGAGPLRLVRQFLAESLLLSLAGCVAGVALAFWGVDVLVALAAAKIPRAHEVTLDWQAFVFLLMVCVSTAVLFGLAPALLGVPGRSAEHNQRVGRAKHRVLAVQVTCATRSSSPKLRSAFVLAFGAAGVMRELSRLERADSGMTTANVIDASPDPACSGS